MPKSKTETLLEKFWPRKSWGPAALSPSQPSPTLQPPKRPISLRETQTE
jgi:hypothetical protein